MLKSTIYHADQSKKIFDACDIEKTAKAIEADAGETLPDLRTALAEAKKAIQEVRDTSNQSWIRSSAREYLDQICICKTDQKAYEVVQEAMMSFGMATNDRAVKTIIQTFQSKQTSEEKGGGNNATQAARTSARRSSQKNECHDGSVQSGT